LQGRVQGYSSSMIIDYQSIIYDYTDQVINWNTIALFALLSPNILSGLGSFRRVRHLLIRKVVDLFFYSLVR